MKWEYWQLTTTTTTKGGQTKDTITQYLKYLNLIYDCKIGDTSQQKMGARPKNNYILSYRLSLFPPHPHTSVMISFPKLTFCGSLTECLVILQSLIYCKQKCKQLFTVSNNHPLETSSFLTKEPIN